MNSSNNITSKLPRVPNVSSSPSSFKAIATNDLIAQHIFKYKGYHIYDRNGKRESVDTLLKKDPIIWGKALSNEWGRLAQGNKYGVIASDTI